MVPSSAQEFMAVAIELARDKYAYPDSEINFRRTLILEINNYVAILNFAILTSLMSSSSPGYKKALKYISWASVIESTDGNVPYYSGLFHRNMGRKDLALAEFVRASSIRPDWFKAAHMAATTATELGEISIARTHIERSLNIHPRHGGMRAAKRALESTSASDNRPTISRFPDALDEMADFSDAISKHLLDKLTFPRVLSSTSRIFTAGSCFATNIAKTLTDHGYTATTNEFGESINSTLANREYFEWLCSEQPYESEFSKLISPARRESTRENFLKSDVIILTVGVAPVFLEKGTGKLRLQVDEGLAIRRLLRDCDFRTLSVSENVENILQLLQTIRWHRPQAEIFITLSPVPLNATFEYPSAIIADCVSKSVLRVAVDEVFRRQPARVHYWPAFEAVRWIGGYRGDAYGADDGATRHVSDHIIQTITLEFVKRTKSI